MTLLFYDGFDHYINTEMGKKWTYIDSITTFVSGRSGNAVRYQVNDDAYVAFPDRQTIVYGHAYKTSSVGSTYPITGLFDAFTTLQVYVGQLNGGGIGFYRGTTLISGTSSGLIAADTWYYLELKVTIDNSVGSYEVRLNEDATPILLESNVDTQQTANASVNSFGWHSFGDFAWRTIDDVYILDTNGSDNNDFLGDVKSILLYPDSSGTYSQWTPTGEASNYLCVDEATPDDDTTYNSATGSSMKDAFSMDDSSVADGTIYGIQTLLYARKDDAGAVSIETIARINGTDYTLSTGAFALGDSYNYYRTLNEVNPDTSGSWSISDINNMEFGYNRSI